MRTLSGGFIRSFQESNFKSFEIVPGSFISKSRFYETTKDRLNFKSLKEEFFNDEEVLILKHPKYLGATARVRGCNEQTNKVSVSIVKELKPVPDQTLFNIANTD